MTGLDDAVEAVSGLTTRPVRTAWLHQHWLDLSFVHWAVDPAVVAPLLPQGIRPDVHEGAAYVGLIGFRMVGLGFGPDVGVGGVPYLGTFLETNVRLYGVDHLGRRAVVFRSLEAQRLLPVLFARVALRLPYTWARMQLDVDRDVLDYRTVRRWPAPRGASSRTRVRVGTRIVQPTPLEDFLTARWGLHTRAWGRTLHLPNEHDRWPLHRAELLDLDDDLVAAAGLPTPLGEPASVLYSPGVGVRFGGPSVVT
ncbi:YqjF family protein [Angustibacter aerolatus]